jgi:hypothetical protein
MIDPKIFKNIYLEGVIGSTKIKMEEVVDVDLSDNVVHIAETSDDVYFNGRDVKLLICHKEVEKTIYKGDDKSER